LLCQRRRQRRAGAIFEETAERFTEIVQINLIGTFLLAQYAAREMVKQKKRLHHLHRVGGGLALGSRWRSL